MIINDDLQKFAEDFQQTIISEAEADQNGLFREEVFTQHVLDLLQDIGELDDATTCQYQKRGMKVNAFSFGEDGQSLNLVVTHCAWDIPPSSISNTILIQIARRGKGFLNQCMSGQHLDMEEADPAFELARRIHREKGEIGRVRIFILTDSLVKDAVIPEENEAGIAITYHVWDIERVFRCISSGSRREPIEIDFSLYGGPITCLTIENDSGIYISYLTIVPGNTLASIYGRWGTRLLEKNVRSFLQLRGNVNKGIHDTILNEPHMFLTYNNGISVTADSVTLMRLENGQLAILKAKDFQIVNGGQTTASLYHSHRKDNADLSQINVQMKLTVLKQPEMADSIISRISQCANTQNKVNIADFSANHPFHREIEELSRTIWAPDPSGGKRLTHWFYERARGQYYDEKGRAGTPAQIRAFEMINPRNQVFTKTDLAKYENTWNQLPYQVSKGAQKNFAEFMASLNQDLKVDEAFFQDLIAKAIIFRQTEKIVSAQNFGGYRANIVTYTIAMIAYHSELRLDISRIWAQQGLTPALKADIERLCRDIHQHMIHAPGGQNVTEWCKKEDCWSTLIEKNLKLSPELKKELISLQLDKESQNGSTSRKKQQDQKVLEKVKRISHEIWLEMSHWANVTNTLEGWQRGILYSVGDTLRKKRTPSIRQAWQALRAYEEAVRKGFKSREVN